MKVLRFFEARLRIIIFGLLVIIVGSISPVAVKSVILIEINKIWKKIEKEFEGESA